MFVFQLPFLPELYLRSYDYAFIDEIFSAQVKGAKKPACDPDEIEAYKWSLSRPGKRDYPYVNYLWSLKKTQHLVD